MTISDVAPYLLIAFILIINISLWASLKNKNTRSQIDLLCKAGMSLNKPWEKENRNLQELNERVKSLRSTGIEPADPSDKEK